MTEQDETKELIKKLARKLTKLEKESRMGLEDQLSFGVIVSLVVFLVTLDLAQTTLFFQKFFGLALDTAMRTAEGVRNTGLLCLVAASATRYYGAVSGQRASKKYRLYSLQCLIGAWNFFILLFIINAFSDASFNLGAMSMPIAGIALVVVYFLMIRFEKKALDFYATKEFIFKKDAKPHVSNAFVLFGAAYYFAFVEELIALAIGFNFAPERFVTVWMLIPIVVMLLLALAERRKKRGVSRRERLTFN